jgi:hypothetical protein
MRLRSVEYELSARLHGEFRSEERTWREGA